MQSTVTLYAAWYDSRFEEIKSKKKTSLTNIVGETIDKLWKPDITFVNGKYVQYDLVPSEGRILKVFQEGNLKGLVYIVRLVSEWATSNFTVGMHKRVRPRLKLDLV